jgi:hypothetical protein
MTGLARRDWVADAVESLSNGHAGWTAATPSDGIEARIGELAGPTDASTRWNASISIRRPM